MNAPDKIYCWFGVMGSLYSSSRKPEDIETTEYIRKDALLEWAKAVKADPMIPMNINKVIEKIESL